MQVKGIDVSEHNGAVDWEEIKNAGYEFAIIRCSYGKSGVDSMFYDNVNGAQDAGLKIGVYHYSYALTVEDAMEEAEFVTALLEDCGLDDQSKLEMKVWFDMEDSDGYKARHGVMDSATLTDICSVFLNTLYDRGYDVGLYCNLDYAENVLYMTELKEFPIWIAQYNSTCDFPSAYLWQYTDSEDINGKCFDGDVLMY